MIRSRVWFGLWGLCPHGHFVLPCFREPETVAGAWPNKRKQDTLVLISGSSIMREQLQTSQDSKPNACTTNVGQNPEALDPQAPEQYNNSCLATMTITTVPNHRYHRSPDTHKPEAPRPYGLRPRLGFSTLSLNPQIPHTKPYNP